MPILENQRHEKLAQPIASGETGAAAYRQTYDARGTSAETGASRLLRNEQVAARISEIRATLAEMQSAADAKAAEQTAEQFTGTLLTMHRRRQLLQQRAESKNITDTALVSVLLADARLAGDLIDKQDLTTSGEALPSLVPSFNITYASHWRESRT